MIDWYRLDCQYFQQTIEFQAAPEPEDSEIEIMLPQDGQDYPIVGLLDSGVTDIEYMRPWLLKEENVDDLLPDEIEKGMVRL